MASSISSSVCDGPRAASANSEPSAPVRTCCACGLTLSIYLFRRIKRNVRRLDCKSCAFLPKPQKKASRADYARAWRAAHPAPKKPRVQRPRAPRKPDPRSAERARIMRQTQPERVAAYQAARYLRRKAEGRTQVDLLRDSYVAATLGLSIAVVPPALIEAKRIHILIKRQLQEKTK